MKNDQNSILPFCLEINHNIVIDFMKWRWVLRF